MSCRFAVVLALIMIAASMYSIAGAQDAPEDSSEGGMVFTDEKEDMWEISVEYPHFESRGMVAVKANVDAEAAARAEFEAFLAQAKAEVPEMQESILVGFYMLNVFPTVTMDIRELCSGYVERVEFTGGANAYSSFSALNYAQGTDGVRKLTLADLFYDGSDGTKVASATILAEVQAWDNPASYVLDGTWTELSPEQAQRFVITEVGLLFLFDKYELGCGAEGTYTVLTPYDNLDGLDYEGYLKPLFDDADE